MRQTPMLQLTLFNYWRLGSDQREFQVPWRSQRLVALLALRGRQNRAHLAGTLWPDVAQQQAQASVRAAIYVLHRRLPPIIDTINRDVFLSDNVTIDVVEFCRQADRVLSRHPPEPPSDIGNPTVTGGELLPGWYDDWVFVERERIQQLRLHVLEAFAHELARRGAHAQALQAAMKATEIDPLRESAWRALVKVHIGQGNTAEAVHEYERFRGVLQEELGVAPTHHLTELIQRVTTRFTSDRAVGLGA